MFFIIYILVHLNQLNFLIEFSQNHTIIESNPTAKVGILQQVVQVGICPGLEHVHKWRFHNLSGQLVPELCHPYHKEVLHVSMELPVFKFYTITPCPIATHPSQSSFPEDEQTQVAQPFLT